MTLDLTRRAALTLAGAVGTAALVTTPTQAQTDTAPDLYDNILLESQSGDPAIAPESLRFNPVAILDTVGTKKGSFIPRISDFGAQLIAQTKARYDGISRDNAHAKVENFLRLFDLPFSMKNKAGVSKVVPFCAAGLSYLACSLYAERDGKDPSDIKTLKNYLVEIDHHHFYPSPSVADIKAVAVGKHRWLSRAQATGSYTPRPGWLVIYNWNHDGWPDHVGIVASYTPQSLTTWEYNTAPNTRGSATNGGSVAQKTRPNNATILGYVRPDLVRVV